MQMPTTLLRSFYVSVQVMLFRFSVTRWVDYLFSIWPLPAIRNIPMGSKNFQSRFNVPSKLLPNTLKFCHSGEISSNLVTLVTFYVLDDFVFYVDDFKVDLIL